jgi:ribonuclease Z
MDHVGGLGYWASQRFLNSMGPARVIVPEAIADDVVGLLAVHARLEGGRPYDVEVVPAAEGSVLQLRRDLDLEPFATDHWVPTLGSLLVWRRRRLRAELVGRSHREIAAMRARGEQVSEEHRVDLLAYCADTGPGLFSQHGGVLGAEVVLLECSFFKPADRDRARRFGHLHLDDLLALAPELRCRHLILLHGSRRHRLPEIESMLEEHLQPKLDCSLHHLMVDWE